MSNYQFSSKLPLVSVIIPAYNAETFIAETLQSVLSQTYSNLEVLVVDDGSQDFTSSIVTSFAQRDSRVILIKQINQGVAAARNLAIEKSRGEYIAPIDADDLWHPQKLEKQVQQFLSLESSVGLIYTWSAYINQQGLLTGVMLSSNKVGDVYIDLLAGNFIGNSSSPLIRRICFKEVGGYNFQMKENNAQGCEDWDLYLRIAERYQFQVVTEFLVGYRQTTSSMSCNCTAMARSYSLMMASVQQRNPALPAQLIYLAKVKYYLYLVDQSIRCGAHGSTLLWLCKVIKLDTSLLLNYSVYKRLIISSLKLIFQPVTTLFWSNHYSWISFRKKINPNDRVYTISDLIAKVGSSAQPSKSLTKKDWLYEWNQTIKHYYQDTA